LRWAAETTFLSLFSPELDEIIKQGRETENNMFVALVVTAVMCYEEINSFTLGATIPYEFWPAQQLNSIYFYLELTFTN
jgi:hypothetical protein